MGQNEGDQRFPRNTFEIQRSIATFTQTQAASSSSQQWAPALLPPCRRDAPRVSAGCRSVSPKDPGGSSQPNQACRVETSVYTHQVSTNIFQELYICWSLNGKFYSYCKLSFKSVLSGPLGHQNIIRSPALQLFFLPLVTGPAPGLRQPRGVTDGKTVFRTVCCMVYLLPVHLVHTLSVEQIAL